MPFSTMGFNQPIKLWVALIFVDLYLRAHTHTQYVGKHDIGITLGFDELDRASDRAQFFQYHD